MRNASIGKLRLRPLRKCSGAWKRVKTVDWNPSDAHQTSGVRHITVANLQFDPFPRFRAPAGENSRQLAQFAVNRGPAPARSRFQPFSFCARSLLSAFCFPSFCFPSSRFQPFSFSVWPPTARTGPVPISGLTPFQALKVVSRWGSGAKALVAAMERSRTGGK